MANKVIMKNSTVAGKRPATDPTNKPGELWVNTTDAVIGSYDPAGAPVELSVSPITVFDPNVAYAKDRLVTRDGHIYRSIVSTPAKPWAATDWDDITVRYDAIQAWAPALNYPINSLVTNGGKIYRATAAVAASMTFDATKWTLIADAAQTFTAGSIPFADTGGGLTEDNAALFWDKANKRLGVGTKTPTQALDVNGFVNASMPSINSAWYFGSWSGAVKFRFGGGVGAGVSLTAIDEYLQLGTDGTGTNGEVRFVTNSTVRAKVDVNGNFGVGNLALANQTRFHVAAGANTGIMLSDLTGAALKGIFYNTNDAQLTLGTVTNHPVAFFTNNGERARLTATGQLGIGVVPAATDPLLTVNSDAKINGMTVGRGGGNDATNVAIGTNALAANTVANNVAIGEGALLTNTKSSQNVAIGRYSLKVLDASSPTTGNNVGLGYATLFRLTSGIGNLAIGATALANVTTANNNIAIGSASGNGITTGSGNVVIGGALGEAAMNNTVIIADGAGGEKVRWTDTGAMQIGQTAEPTGIAGKLHLWFNGTNLMMKVGTGAATIVK